MKSVRFINLKVSFRLISRFPHFSNKVIRLSYRDSAVIFTELMAKRKTNVKIRMRLLISIFFIMGQERRYLKINYSCYKRHSRGVFLTLNEFF